jgi:hypothetical protein
VNDADYEDEGERIRELEDEPGDVGLVTLQFSPTTMRLLERLAEVGLFGIGVQGVCEGFVYRGLQATTQELEET